MNGAEIVAGQSLPCRLNRDPSLGGELRLWKRDLVLIAEDVNAEHVSPTTASGSGWRLSEVVRHQTPLLSLSQDALRNPEPLDRTISALVPAEAAGNKRPTRDRR